MIKFATAHLIAEEKRRVTTVITARPQARSHVQSAKLIMKLPVNLSSVIVVLQNAQTAPNAVVAITAHSALRVLAILASQMAIV